MALRVNDHRSNTLNPYRTYFSPPVILKYIDSNLKITFRRSNEAAIFFKTNRITYMIYPCAKHVTESQHTLKHVSRDSRQKVGPKCN